MYLDKSFIGYWKFNKRLDVYPGLFFWLDLFGGGFWEEAFCGRLFGGGGPDGPGFYTDAVLLPPFGRRSASGAFGRAAEAPLALLVAVFPQ